MKLSSALYESDWIKRSKSYQKTVFFMMFNMQKELIVRVGGLVDLTLQTLVAVESYNLFVLCIVIVKFAFRF